MCNRLIRSILYAAKTLVFSAVFPPTGAPSLDTVWHTPCIVCTTAATFGVVSSVSLLWLLCHNRLWVQKHILFVFLCSAHLPLKPQTKSVFLRWRTLQVFSSKPVEYEASFYFFILWVSTNALIAALICSGNFGQTWTISAKSGGMESAWFPAIFGLSL